MRLTLMASAICLSLVAISTAADAAARRVTNIAAQELAPALQLLARQRAVQVVYRSELVQDRRTSGASGNLTLEEALTQLLNGTGLTFRYIANNAITIVPMPSGVLPSPQQTKTGDHVASAPAASGAEDGSHEKQAAKEPP